MNSFFSARTSRDIPSSHRHLRDSSNAESKLINNTTADRIRHVSYPHKRNEADRKGQAAPIRNSVHRRTEFPKRTMTSSRRDFLRFAPPHPYSSSCLSFNPLGKLVSLSSFPLHEKFKMAAKLFTMWALLGKILPALQANTRTAIKIRFPWQLILSQSPSTLFQYVGVLKLTKF